LLTVQPLSAIPGFPSNVEAWTRLPGKNSTSRGLRVEVWTERVSYGVDAEVTFHVRSNRDCYVSLLDLQTSGGVYVLFPNAFQKENRVLANQVYSIPGSEAPFSINASGPTGVEGVKAIASIRPLTVETLTGGGAFASAGTPELQIRLCEQIQSAIKDLDENEWDVGEWTFEVTPR
jgi:hypothetical protein